MSTPINNMNGKQAFGFGLVAGILVLCTIGFFVLLGILLNGGTEASTNPSLSATKDNTVQEPVDDAEPVISVPKSNKPVVELFVMSHCPYGLQMEKAFLPAWELLDDKADMSVKFVFYAMHGKKELEEQNRQYCIQNEQKDKYISYLTCFVGEDNPEKCLQTAGVNSAKVTACVNKLEKDFGTMAKFADSSTWLSGQYPLYPVYDDLNEQYGVQGSPALVINGQQVSANRSPEAVKAIICQAFNQEPKECETTLSTSSASAGFGGGVGSDAQVECGT